MSLRRACLTTATAVLSIVLWLGAFAAARADSPGDTESARETRDVGAGRSGETEGSERLPPSRSYNTDSFFDIIMSEPPISGPDISPKATDSEPVSNLCAKQPAITSPADQVIANENDLVLSVSGCEGTANLELVLVKDKSARSQATYAITSLPWSEKRWVEDGGYTLILRRGDDGSEIDSLHFEVAKLQ